MIRRRLGGIFVGRLARYRPPNCVSPRAPASVPFLLPSKLFFIVHPPSNIATTLSLVGSSARVFLPLDPSRYSLRPPLFATSFLVDQRPSQTFFSFWRALPVFRGGVIPLLLPEWSGTENVFSFSPDPFLFSLRRTFYPSWHAGGSKPGQHPWARSSTKLLPSLLFRRTPPLSPF